MGHILSGNLGTDSEFPANCAGNSCLAPVCGVYTPVPVATSKVKEPRGARGALPNVL